MQTFELALGYVEKEYENTYSVVHCCMYNFHIFSIIFVQKKIMYV